MEEPVNQDIINLYDRFTHGGMSRRTFLDRLPELAGSTVAAARLLPLLQNDYPRAAIVRPDGRRLTAEPLTYQCTQGTTRRYRIPPPSQCTRASSRVTH